MKIRTLHQLQNQSLQQPVQAVPYKPPYNEEIEFYHFLKTLRVEERGHFLYRDQIRKNINTGCYDVNIDMCHIAGWDPLLEHKLLKSPEKVLLKLKRAASRVGEEVAKREVEMQINLKKDVWVASSLRALQLQSSRVGELVKIEGIIVSTQKPGVKHRTVELGCRGCGHKISLGITGSTLLPLMLL